MNDGIVPVVGRRIAKLRRAAGMTRQELARRVGIGPHQLKAYEEGRLMVPASHLWSIADVQDVPMFFYFEDHREEGDR